MTTTVVASDLAISTAISAFSPEWRTNITPTTFKPEYDILIYGATSFTAKIMIDYLCTHPQASEFSFIMAGRTEKKMRELQAEIKRKGYGKRDITVFALTDGAEGEAGVEKAIGSCKVVINLAGELEMYASAWHVLMPRSCFRPV